MVTGLKQSKSENRVEISVEQFYEIVEVARFAPSGDNCQPWKFHLVDGEIEIRYDNKRGEHALNNNEHASFLALGTVIESIYQKALHFDLEIIFDQISSKIDLLQKSGLRIGFAATQRSAESLAVWLKERCTDRRPFQTSSLSELDQKDLKQRLDEFAEVQVELRPTLSSAFAKYAIHSDEFMWKNESVLRDLVKWIRYDEASSVNSNDGMPWQNLGIKKQELPMFRWMLANPQWIKRIWPFGFGFKVNMMTKQSLLKSGGFLVVAVRSNQPRQLINAGRAAMRAWLFFTSKGFNMQPLSLASLTAFDFMTGHAPHYASQSFSEFYQQSLSIYQKEFTLSPGMMPVWMLRYGIPEETSKLVRTPRKPVEELVI